MALLKKELDFVSPRRRKIITTLSAVMVVACFLSLAINRLELGLDFTSGTLIEVGYAQPVDPVAVTQQLADNGYPDAVVVTFGSDRDVLVRLPASDVEGEDAARAAASLGDEVLRVLQASSSDQVEMRRTEFVGPKVGAELAEKGGLAVLVALGIMMLYVAVRFQYKFAIGAVVALMHDAIIVLGVISFFGLTFDLTVLAALLAVIGYSLNDTIVVCDRIRENFRIMRSNDVVHLINVSLNQVLSRSMITSLTSLLALFSMLIVGSEAIMGFAITLITGVMIGTYTSLNFLATMLVYQNLSKEDLTVPVKEGVDDVGSQV